MAQNDKKANESRLSSTQTSSSSDGSPVLQSKPYEGSATFKRMIKKAEQSMADHEFKS